MWKRLVESSSVRVAWYLFCVLVACGSVLACGALFGRWMAATLVAKEEAARNLAYAEEEAARKRAFEESWAIDERQSSKNGERKKPMVARSSATKVPPAVTTPAMMKEPERQKMRPAEETARKLALEEEQEERKKSQQGKTGNKKYERTTLRETQVPPQPREELEEVAGTAVGVKGKSNKKNKSKKPVRAPHEQQKVLEPTSMPATVIEEEEREAMTLQVSVQEQQSLVISDEGVQFAARAAAEAPTIVEAEGETSIPCPPLPHEGDDDESDEEGKDDHEEFGPDEAFLLEDASSMLVCPISFKLMTSAVIAMDTQSYQKEALEEWIERCKTKGLPLTSPLNNAPMESQTMNNQALRGLVGEHIEAREQAWRQQVAEKINKKNKKSK